VKNQTPKVERQEHAKKATGRAKKREMYNRRIIGPFATVNGKRRLNPAPVK
ncbi:ribosomal 40S subunit protein S30B, partial [Coemansia helicoidea]